MTTGQNINEQPSEDDREIHIDDPQGHPPQQKGSAREEREAPGPLPPGGDPREGEEQRRPQSHGLPVR